ncbi:MAG: hypothetical protein RLZZ342_536 [Candidatus Parcubacteria bacterium]|jgi:hypothetical protein
MANRDPLLSFEEFRKTQNNFFLHFIGTPGEHHFGDLYRSHEAYQEARRAYPRVFDSLAAGLCDMNPEETNKVLQDERFIRKLYRAYCYMYPFAQSNWDLFA